MAGRSFISRKTDAYDVFYLLYITCFIHWTDTPLAMETVLSKERTFVLLIKG